LEEFMVPHPHRPKKGRDPGKARAKLDLTHPNAAGIDIGSASHFVAVPPDRNEQPVREFQSFTDDLGAIADWLQACGVDTVAMESTGVYWIPLFELLDSRGFNPGNAFAYRDSPPSRPALRHLALAVRSSLAQAKPGSPRSTAFACAKT
jgi:hypothetical protein